MSTHYVEQPWADGAAGDTPVTAAALGHIEDGIGDAHDRIDALTTGMALTPTSTRTSTVAPAAGELVTYDASAGNIGPIPLPPPQAGVILGVVKGDASPNTITFTSANLLGNGGSPTITLRATGENRTLYGSATGWYVNGYRAPIVGTTAGTIAAGNDSRFANVLASVVYGGATRTAAPLCEVHFTAPNFTTGAADLYAMGNWQAVVDTERTSPTAGDGMLRATGGFSTISIPLTGRYQHDLYISGSTSANTIMNARITRNEPQFRSSLAVDIRRYSVNDPISLHASGNDVLNQGDLLYWATYTSAGVLTVVRGLDGSPSARTRIIVRYVGPG
jgi:hypothetical protein